MVFWGLNVGREQKRASELARKWADLGCIRLLPRVLFICFAGCWLDPKSVPPCKAQKINFSPTLILQCCASLISQGKFELQLPKIPAVSAAGHAETLAERTPANLLN